MNKVARLTEFIDPKGISCVDEQIPSPGTGGEVLLKMKTAGLNRVEALIKYGRFPVMPQLPAI